ncbi:MAG: hypothetical protein QOG82_2069 [Actinomycetota bacterium]|nr:hypothetical protein [Actinomycetota bacterium]
MADEEPLEEFYGDEWPAETEGAADGEPPADGEPRVRSDAGGGRKRSVTGALMAGIALGLREVFEPEVHDRTAIEQPAPEQPLEPQKYEIHLDPVSAESSFAIYRPWVDGTEGEVDPQSDPPTPPPPAEPPPPPKGGGAGALGG